jgi:hypothetical protein
VGRCYPETLVRGPPLVAILLLLPAFKCMIIFLFSLNSYDFWPILLADLLLHDFLHFFIYNAAKISPSAHVVQYENSNRGTASIEVGHEVDASVKAHSFVNLSATVANSWQNFPASPAENCYFLQCAIDDI